MTCVIYVSSGVASKASPMISAVSSPRAEAALSAVATSTRTAQALAHRPAPIQRTAEVGIDPPSRQRPRSAYKLLPLALSGGLCGGLSHVSIIGKPGRVSTWLFQ